jgi:transcriptional regulator with XRE-family HTH domain
MDDATAGESLRSLAQRLDHLFRTVRKPDGKEYSLREVADAITEAGDSISHAYVGQLRSGEKDDPRMSHLRGLASFFGVPVTYFFDEDRAAEVDRDLEVLLALKDGGVRVIAQQARGLSTGNQDVVLQIIKQLARAQAQNQQSRASDSRRSADDSKDT